MRGAKRDVIRFVLDFQYLFLNRRVKEDAPRQKPAERRIQRESGLGFAYFGDVRQDELMVQYGLVGPGKM